MEWLTYVIAAIFTLFGAGCVVLIVFTLPGTWIMIAAAFIIELADALYLTDGRQQTFPWWLLISTVVLAGIGEVMEFVVGAEGARRGGAGRRGIFGALIGGVAGAILLTGLIPIPIVGTLIGAVIGSFAGAIIGEVSGSQPKRVQESIRPALGAAGGRLLGTLGKIALAIAIWLSLAVAAFWP